MTLNNSLIITYAALHCYLYCMVSDTDTSDLDMVRHIRVGVLAKLMDGSLAITRRLGAFNYNQIGSLASFIHVCIITPYRIEQNKL